MTDSNNKIKVIIYYSKFNATDLFSYYNFFPLTSYLSTKNVMYQFLQ